MLSSCYEVVSQPSFSKEKLPNGACYIPLVEGSIYQCGEKKKNRFPGGGVVYSCYEEASQVSISKEEKSSGACQHY